jgi:hypothetical protein
MFVMAGRQSMSCSKPHPCLGCKGGNAPREVNLEVGSPLVFQAAVRKWVRTGNSVQIVDPSNLKQYW